MHLSSQATQEAEIRKTVVPVQSGQKSLLDPISTEKSWVWQHVIPAMTGSIKWEDCGPTSLSKKRDPISKITRAKSVRGVAQVIEQLPYKHEAPN
jgi:hypothetical protein